MRIRAVWRALGPGDGDGSGAQLRRQEALQLADAVAQPSRQGGHSLAVDQPVRDQAHGPSHDVGPGVPLGRPRRGIGPAALAGAKSGQLGGGGGGVEADVLPLGGRCRAAGPAVDAGRGDRGEEPPVEARVPGLHGDVAAFEVFDHGTSMTRLGGRCLAGMRHGRRPRPSSPGRGGRVGWGCAEAPPAQSRTGRSRASFPVSQGRPAAASSSHFWRSSPRWPRSSGVGPNRSVRGWSALVSK